MKAAMTCSTPGCGGADPRRWLALGVLLAGTLLPPLDFFVVNVALPAIQADLQATPTLAQLVVSVYAAAYAVTLILGGRLGDLYGRKRMFIVGMLGFGVASAVCGCAPSPGILVAGRLLQGIGAAIMAPQSLASIHAIFPAREKSRALGMYGATFGAASVAGQLLGGLLVSVDLFGLGWRTVFLINLPVIALAVPAAISWVRDSRSEHAGRLDVEGALLLAAGLLAVVVPLIEGRERGWPWWCAGLLTLGPPLLLAFWRFERRQERGHGTPLVPPSVLASPGLQRSLAATFFFYTIAPFFLVFAVYEQTELGHDALTAGLAVLPLGIGFLLGPLCGATVARRPGANAAAFGMGLEVVGMLAAASLAWIDAPAWLPAPLFLIGIGQGIALPALVRLNVDQVDARWAGLAAGLVNATLQISAAVSTATIGGLFFALSSHGAGPGAVKAAFSVTLLAIGAGLGLAAVLIRTPRWGGTARA